MASARRTSPSNRTFGEEVRREALRGHIDEHGRPVSLYSDRLAKEKRLPGIDDMEAACAGPSPVAGVQGLPAGRGVSRRFRPNETRVFPPPL